MHSNSSLSSFLWQKVRGLTVAAAGHRVRPGLRARPRPAGGFRPSGLVAGGPLGVRAEQPDAGGLPEVHYLVAETALRRSEMCGPSTGCIIGLMLPV